MLMAIENGGDDLFHNLGCLLLTERLLLLDLIEKFTTKTKFSHNVKELIVLIELINLDNVGMVLWSIRKKMVPNVSEFRPRCASVPTRLDLYAVWKES
jgi:hypothetical protein